MSREILNINDFSDTVRQEVFPPAEYTNYFTDNYKRITLLCGSNFLNSYEFVLKFLNLGFGSNTNVIALKGLGTNPDCLDGVAAEFFFDGHPKAIKVPENIILQAGITLPFSGIIDPTGMSVEKIGFLKGKILKMRNSALSPELKAAVIKFESSKFQALGDGKKQQINEVAVYANCHIFDLVVKDKLGQYVIVPTYRNSPIVSDACHIDGIGPETKKIWGKIIDASDLIITVGNMKPYSDLLSEQVA